MADGITVKVDPASIASIKKNIEQWPKAVDLTIKTMARRAPVIVARNAAQSYNIAQSRLNPRNKTAKGHVSISGGITDLTLTYTGPRLSVTEFKGLKPRSARKRPYSIMGQVVKGQTSKMGHWSKPGSEGGRYSGNSPWMYVPGVPGPVMRLGSRLGGTMRALSVPQMVVSQRHDEATISELQDTMMNELARQCARFGIT